MREVSERLDARVADARAVEPQALEARHRADLRHARVGERALREIEVRHQRRDVGEHRRVGIAERRLRATDVDVEERAVRGDRLHEHAARDERLGRGLGLRAHGGGHLDGDRSSDRNGASGSCGRRRRCSRGSDHAATTGGGIRRAVIDPLLEDRDLFHVESVALGRHRVGVGARQFDALHERAVRTLARNDRPLLVIAVEEPRLRIHAQAALLLARAVALEAVLLEDRADVGDEGALCGGQRGNLAARGSVDVDLLRLREHELGHVAFAVHDVATEVARDAQRDAGRKRHPAEGAELRDGAPRCVQEVSGEQVAPPRKAQQRGGRAGSDPAMQLQPGGHIVRMLEGRVHPAGRGRDHRGRSRNPEQGRGQRGEFLTTADDAPPLGRDGDQRERDREVHDGGMEPPRRASEIHSSLGKDRCGRDRREEIGERNHHSEMYLTAPTRESHESRRSSSTLQKGKAPGTSASSRRFACTGRRTLRRALVFSTFDAPAPVEADSSVMQPRNAQRAPTPRTHVLVSALFASEVPERHATDAGIARIYLAPPFAHH